VVAEGLPGRLDGIRRRLLAWVDPATGRRPLAEVLAGPSDGGPDLLLIMNGGYGAEPRPPGPRAPVGRPVTRQAPAAWSGGHVAQASDRVAGILFVNRPLVAGRPRVIDVTPTLMVAAGLPVPPTLGGRPLLAEQQGTR